MDNNRRKLVLGSAAVPLVLTVRPAAAHAKKSIACIADGKEPDKPWEMLKTNGDGFMRKWVAVCNLKVHEGGTWKLQKWNQQKSKMYICGTDGCYWLLHKDDPFHADAQKTDLKKGWGVQEIEVANMQALAYYSSETFQESGWGWETKGGKYYKKSCWNSIKPKGWT